MHDILAFKMHCHVSGILSRICDWVRSDQARVQFGCKLILFFAFLNYMVEPWNVTNDHFHESHR